MTWLFPIPRFFKTALLPENESKVKARHDVELNLADLFAGVNLVLDEKGKFYLIYPFSGYADLLTYSRINGLYCNEALLIRSFVNKPVNRIIVKFERTSSAITEKELVIYKGHKQYTKDYTEIVKDFYLHF